MKSFLSCLLLLIVEIGFTQIPEVTIKDSTLLAITDEVLDTINAPQLQKGVVTLYITKLSIDEFQEEVPDERHGKVVKMRRVLNYNVRASFELNALNFEFHVPDFYFLHRERLIFVYTGEEFFAKPNERTINELKKLIKGKMPNQGTFVSPTFWLEVKGKEFKFIRRGIMNGPRF